MSPFPSSIKKKTKKQGWIQFLVPKPRCTSESPGGSASHPVTTLPRLQKACRDPVLGELQDQMSQKTPPGFCLCPEQPQVYLGKTPYSLDAWGRGGIAWSAADLTKTPPPQGKWGPKGDREKWAETASPGGLGYGHSRVWGALGPEGGSR